MKRIIYILAFAVALASCQKELYMEPGVSFFSASPEIHEETAVFRLASEKRMRSFFMSSVELKLLSLA